MSNAQSAAALATPGYLVGGMASLWLGDFDTCSAAGAMLGAVVGVAGAVVTVGVATVR